MAIHVCKAANRAFVLLIAKSKAFRGFDYRTFSKLYDTTVWSVISYGAAFLGNRQLCSINSIQVRAGRYYMGVGKYTPNAVVHGDSGWKPIDVRLWSSVLNQWIRIKLMDNSRINSRSFDWCERNCSCTCKNWNYRVNMMLREAGTPINSCVLNYREMKEQVIAFVLNKFKNEWLQDVNRENARQGNGKNKLRMYSQYKQDFQSEAYLKCSVSRAHRSAYAKFLCGVASIRTETGRYERLKLRLALLAVIR